MEKQNWNQIGNEIKDLVQDAVRTGDFTRLNESVSSTVKKAMDQLDGSVSATVQKAVAKAESAWNTGQDSGAKARQQERRNRGGTEGRTPFSQRWVGEPPARSLEGKVYARVTGLRTGACARMILGGILTAGFGAGVLALLLVLAFAGAPGTGYFFGLGVLLALLLGSIFLFAGGASRLGFLKRYRRYVGILGERSYFELKELASRTGKALDFVKKDVRKMLDQGFFLQGRLDEGETCLMVTDEAYRQYQDAMEQKRRRERQEEMFGNQARITPQVQKILEEGNFYLEKIRACNDRIPGEEISRKISRMELVIQRIFQRVKEHPEAAEELQRMMNYYLPTTVKLLEAYGDMDAQPVQGENISTAKKEIEDTLDTLNAAFEKLLDEIFKDTAWDVSTDISVLHTLLAQEGLTGGDFSQK